MQVKMSGYLMEIKPKVKELITLLDNEFELYNHQLQRD